VIRVDVWSAMYIQIERKSVCWFWLLQTLSSMTKFLQQRKLRPEVLISPTLCSSWSDHYRTRTPIHSISFTRGHRRRRYSVTLGGSLVQDMSFGSIGSCVRKGCVNVYLASFLTCKYGRTCTLYFL